MPLEGNSHRERESGRPSTKHEPMAPVANGKIEKKKDGLIMSFLRQDGDNIKEYVIETIVIPGILDAVGGIGDIILDSLAEVIGLAFEKRGFSSSEKRKGGKTDYRSISKKKKGRHFYRDEEDVAEEEDDERSYDNVRVKTEREAKEVIEKLRERIDEVGYATVANLYELTENIVTWTDHQHGWTSLNSADWVRTRDRKKPWLLVFPKPKNLKDLK